MLRINIKQAAERCKWGAVHLSTAIHRAIGHGYTMRYPYLYSTVSPWYFDSFQQLFDRVRARTVVTEDRCYMLRQFAKHCLALAGDFAECGVFKGGTALLLADLLEDTSKTLHLFDTFQGMPESAMTDASGHRTGDFGDTSLESVKQFLAAYRCIEFHPGFIPDTLQPLQDKQFAFVHVDVDLYSSVRDCCAFFYDRMSPGGVIIFDDYGFKMYRMAARKAVDEFFQDKPEDPIVLPTGQCLVLKSPV